MPANFEESIAFIAPEFANTAPSILPFTEFTPFNIKSEVIFPILPLEPACISPPLILAESVTTLFAINSEVRLSTPPNALTNVPYTEFVVSALTSLPIKLEVMFFIFPLTSETIAEYL